MKKIVILLEEKTQDYAAGIFIKDNVSNITHIAGGVVGLSLGFIMNKNKMNRY